MLSFIKRFLHLEASSGIILMVIAVIAMAAANSPMAESYVALRDSSLSFWVNDGLMAIFFLMIGAEIKREITEGELASIKQSILPIVAALGGVITPAIIYAFFNWGQAGMRGWAIPSATDIAFSLGILALFGSRVTPSLKIFLMAVAVIDDLAAVIIIAAFYTDHISLPALLGAIVCLLALWGMNHKKIQHILYYLIIGGLMWAATLKSGVHPTVAGVMLGLMLPEAMGKKTIHALHPWVAYAIVPLFAFLNAGISFSGINLEQLSHPVTAGIALGLFAGKQLGIFGASWLLVRSGMAAWPTGAGKIEFYAVCMIAGIGFTMSLFIGALAFGNGELQLSTRLGVITGSLLSAIAGVILMAVATRRKAGIL